MFDTCSFKPTNDGFPPSSGGGGGAVSSVFGRTGVVIAVAGDYNSTQITNSSAVTGAFVTDALNTLNSGKMSNTLPDTQIFVGNVSNVATAVAMSGDATISNTGAVTLKNTGTAGTYGSATQVPVLTTDAQGRVTAVTNTAITGFVPTTLNDGLIIVGNGSNVATAVAMSGDATISNTGAVTLKNTGTAGTYGSATQVPVFTTDAQGRVTAVTNTTLSAAVYTYLAITLSADTSYNKAALGGANYLYIQTNSATSRAITIDNTGFAANDFLVLSFAQTSLGTVSFNIGTASYGGNRGTTYLAVYNGTDWVIQLMANSMLSVAGSQGSTILGTSANGGGHSPVTAIGFDAVVTGASGVALGSNVSAASQSIVIGSGVANATGTNSISIGYNATGSGINSVRIGSGTQTGISTGVVAIGQGITSTGIDAVGIGRAVGIGGTEAIAIGRGADATANGSISIGGGADSLAAGTVVIGQNGNSSGANTVAIGLGVSTGVNTGVVAIGQGITNTNTDNIIIGRGASAGGTQAITIGALAAGGTANSVTLGYGASSSPNSIAIGWGATSSNDNSVSLGYNSTSNSSSVTVGAGSQGTGTNTVRVGQGVNTSTNTGVVAIGQGIITTNTDAVVIGRAASAGGTSNVTIGAGSTGTGTKCVRIGSGIGTSTSASVTAIGANTTGGSNCIVIGADAAAASNNTIHLGANSFQYSSDSVTIGNSTVWDFSTGTRIVQIGNATTINATNSNSVIIGYGNVQNSNCSESVGVGYIMRINKPRQFTKGAYAYPRHYGAESRRIDTNTSSSDATNPSRHTDNTAWNGSTSGTTLELLLFAQTGEYLTVQNNELLHFMVMVSAKKEGATDSRIMILNGGAVATGGVASLVGSGLIGTSDFNNSAGAAALVATLGVTSNRITMTVDSTDPASTGTWHWTANIINITRTRTA